MYSGSALCFIIHTLVKQTPRVSSLFLTLYRTDIKQTKRDSWPYYHKKSKGKYIQVTWLKTPVILTGGNPFTITSMAQGVKLMTAEKQYGLHGGCEGLKPCITGLQVWRADHYLYSIPSFAINYHHTVFPCGHCGRSYTVHRTKIGGHFPAHMHWRWRLPAYH